MATSRTALAFAAAFAAFAPAAFSQTTPAAVPVPIVMAVAGGASTVCAAAIATTDGSAIGDGCPGTQAKLTAPQGEGVDKYGNIYVADYTDKLIRVVYNGNPLLGTAIKAANSGFTIAFGGQASRTAPAPTPVVGNLYSIAGVGANATNAAYTYTTLTVKNMDGNFACGNVAGNADAINSFGDGCPAASAPVAARDAKVDSDGNLFIVDYSNSRIRVICVNCLTSTAAYKLIQLGNGTTVTPTNGDIYTIAGFSVGYRDAVAGYIPAGNTTGTTAATATTAQFRTPTGIAISSSDDLYIADNLNNALRVLYNGGTVAASILSAQGVTSPTVGFVYTIAGAGCVSAAVGKTGSVASANSCLTTTDSDTATLGNANGTTPVWSVYLDPNNNIFYTDATNARVKFIYGGVAAPIGTSAAYTTLQTGYSYTYAGQGAVTTANGVTPNSLKLGSAQSIGGDAFGNIFFADYSTGLFYGVSAETGIATIFAGGGLTTAATGGYCNGLASGPTMTDTSFDGCPATQAAFTSTRGPIVEDTLGNLYFGDAVGNLAREFTFNPTFAATTVGSTGATQPYAFTFQTATPITSVSVLTSGATSSDFADAGGDTCTTALTVAIGAPGTTCVVYVKFTPSAVGARPGAVLLNGATGILGQTAFSAIGNGAALALDPATFTITGSGYTPNGVAIDGSGRLFFSDTTTKSVIRYTGATPATLATGFTLPAGVTIDNAGNVFVTDTTANSVTEIPIVGTKFTMSTALNAPHQVAVDSLGRVYIADTGNNRIIVFGTTGTKTFSNTGITGLTSPTGVAVDSAFNIYAADSTHIVKLTPQGLQTTVATQTGLTTLSVDAAGDLYSVSGTTLIDITPAGTKNTLYTSLGNATAATIDATGNIYVADTGNGGIDTLQRTAGYYKFTGTSGTTSIELSSLGTTSVSTTAFTATDTTDYTISPSTTNGCSGALTSGTTCFLTATYLPKNPGILTDNISFTAPVSNGTPTFTLVNVSLIPAITLKGSATTLAYGSTETLTATVYGTGNYPGTVNFYNNGSSTAFASIAVNTSGIATYSYQPAVGSYSVVATYTPTGASAPTVTSTPPVIYTVTQTTPSINVTVTPQTGYATTTFTATATLTATYGTPTGTVTFYLGTTALGTVALTSPGVATFTTSSLPVGTDCITASYSGDTNDATVKSSACTNVVVAPGFAVTPSSSALAFQPNYQEAQTTLNITTGGRSDTISFACAGLPAKLACNFSPATVTLAGNSSTVPVQMLVSNSAATYGELHNAPFSNHFTTTTITAALLPFAGALIFGMRRRKRLASMLGVMLLTLGLAASLTGCSTQDPTTLYQASGNYNFTVNVNSGTTTLTTLPFTLTIP